MNVKLRNGNVWLSRRGQWVSEAEAEVMSEVKGRALLLAYPGELVPTDGELLPVAARPVEPVAVKKASREQKPRAPKPELKPTVQRTRREKKPRPRKVVRPAAGPLAPRLSRHGEVVALPGRVRMVRVLGEHWNDPGAQREALRTRLGLA